MGSSGNKSNLSSINQPYSSLGGLNQLGNLGALGAGQLPTLTNFNALTSLSQLGLNPQQKDLIAQQELLNLNHELLNRLQNLNVLSGLGSTAANVANNNPSNQLPFLYSGLQTVSGQGPQSSAYCSQNSSNSSGLNNNALNTPSSASGTLTPSPMGTLSRKSSPMDLNLGVSNKSLDNFPEAQFIRPLSQIGTMTTLDADGRVKVIVPITESGDVNANVMRQQTPVSSSKKPEKKVSIPGIVTTDERGVMRRNASTTSAPGGSATPSFIMRSSSEKVPSRSQIMSEVQRTQWARHTTK